MAAFCLVALRKQIFLQDWNSKLDQFLEFNDRNVLSGAGNISKKAADEQAKKVFDDYAQQRRRLKEAEGEMANIAALNAILDESKNNK